MPKFKTHIQIKPDYKGLGPLNAGLLYFIADDQNNRIEVFYNEFIGTPENPELIGPPKSYVVTGDSFAAWDNQIGAAIRPVILERLTEIKIQEEKKELERLKRIEEAKTKEVE